MRRHRRAALAAACLAGACFCNRAAAACELVLTEHRSGAPLQVLPLATVLERLQQTLAHVYANNRHYRAAFDAVGVTPDDCRSLADIVKFPFTTKTDLRDNYPFGMFAVPRQQVARVHASSGTTGKPTVVGYSRNDIANWAHLVARSIRASGGASTRVSTTGHH